MTIHNEREKLIISNCMDGELSTDELTQDLHTITNDVALKKQWSRYHLIKTALQDDNIIENVDIANSVMQSVATVKTTTTNTSLNFIQKFWLWYAKPMYAFASVFVIGLLTVLLWPTNFIKSDVLPINSVNNSQWAGRTMQPVSNEPVEVEPDPVLSERLKIYLAKHGETSFQKHRGGGFVPYSPELAVNRKLIYVKSDQATVVSYSNPRN